MGNYTSFLEDMTYDIFEEEDYVEELKKAAELFRTFDKSVGFIYFKSWVRRRFIKCG